MRWFNEDLLLRVARVEGREDASGTECWWVDGGTAISFECAPEMGPRGLPTLHAFAASVRRMVRAPRVTVRACAMRSARLVATVGRSHMHVM